MESLVDTTWLASHLADDDVVVLHCTVFLKPRTDGKAGFVAESGRPAWAEGHIPNSAHVDLGADLSDPESALRFMVPSAARFAAAMEAVGVGDQSRVVLYDDALNMWAARIWWMLRSFGFDRAAVLDGGWKAWLATGHPTSTEVPPTPRQVRFTASPRTGLFTDRDEVLAVSGGAGCLIDALGEAQYRGEATTYGRPGHIPGAANVPAMALVDPETNRYRPLDQLRPRFAALAPDPDQRVVTYCGGGIAASSDAFVLHRLGYRNVAVYDASLQEWATDPTLPLEVAR